jgi:hypothetical protein
LLPLPIALQGVREMSLRALDGSEGLLALSVTIAARIIDRDSVCIKRLLSGIGTFSVTDAGLVGRKLMMKSTRMCVCVCVYSYCAVYVLVLVRYGKAID